MSKTVAPLSITIVSLIVTLIANVLGQYGITFTSDECNQLTQLITVGIGVVAGTVGLINHIRTHRDLKAQLTDTKTQLAVANGAAVSPAPTGTKK